MWRSILILTASFLLFTGPLLAQRPSYGLKGGPHMSSFHAANLRTTLIPGITIGGYAPVSLSPRFDLQPELLLSTLGTGVLGTDGERSELRTANVQLPILAKYFLTRRLNIQAGPQIGYLFLATEFNNGNINTISDRFKPLDIGTCIGIAIDGRRGTDLTFRYYSGIVPIMKDDEKIFPRNRSFQLSIGKRFVQSKRASGGRRRK